MHLDTVLAHPKTALFAFEHSAVGRYSSSRRHTLFRRRYRDEQPAGSDALSWRSRRAARTETVPVSRRH